VITKQENLELVSEIYNDFCNAGARNTDSDDPVVKFMGRPENAAITEVICREYPHAIKVLATIRLLKAVRERCQSRLQADQRWKVVLDPEDDQQRVAERWPAVSIEPNPGREDYWAFYLQIDANTNRLPFKLAHGVVCSVAGGKPHLMSEELTDAVNATKDRFVERGFKVMTSNWLAVTQLPYRYQTLGDDPDVLASLLSGTLADDISDKLIQLFEDWSGAIEKLNSMIT
jgi:hypothetical protein